MGLLSLQGMMSCMVATRVFFETLSLIAVYLQRSDHVAQPSVSFDRLMRRRLWRPLWACLERNPKKKRASGVRSVALDVGARIFHTGDSQVLRSRGCTLALIFFKTSLSKVRLLVWRTCRGSGAASAVVWGLLMSRDIVRSSTVAYIATVPS